jgi:cysteine desulfurase/selenocysteine lyase
MVRRLASSIVTINVRRIREDFPVLRRKVNGKPLVYLDNAATSQKPRQVIEVINEYYRWYNANIHRGIHKLSEEATLAYESARERIADFVGGRSEEIIFTRNATEALNLVAFSWGRANIRKGDRILLTEMEHHSNIVPWQLLGKAKDAELRYVRVTDDGYIDMDSFEQEIAHKPKILCITHMSNVLGTINPLKEMTREAHQVGCTVLVDAAQSVPHMPVDVGELGCDFLAFSGHKMMGPTGVGILWGRKELLEGMEPFLGGGEMIREVHLYEAAWKDIPWKFEAGTPNIVGAIGLGAAVDYLNELGMPNVRDHEFEIAKYAIETLTRVPGFQIYGPRKPDDRGAVISFNLGDIHAHDLASILDEEGIAIRSGHHCAQPLMERLNIPAASRASFYVYNLKEEVDILADALHKARKIFKL